MRQFKHGKLAAGCADACCLKLEGLSVRLQGDSILEDVSFHLHCGEIVALILSLIHISEPTRRS